jgi:Flp pilus assembly protein TadD/outer membrane protein OmpA-like peptidoglycan-associated protein
MNIYHIKFTKMKKLYLLSVIALVALILSSCGLGKMVPNNQITLKLENSDLENKGGKVEYAVKGNVPPKFLKKKATVDIQVPVFMNDDGSNKTEIKSIKLVGEKSKEQGTVIPFKSGGSFSVSGNFPYQDNLSVQGIYGIGTAKAGKKEFTYPSQKLGEGISNTSSRIGINPVLSEKPGNGTNLLYAAHNYKPEFETQTGNIYFDLNKSDLNWNLPLNKNDKAKQVLGDLKNYLFNAIETNRNIQKIVISGWASPEGEESLNQGLSEKRYDQGKKWFDKQMEDWKKEYAKKNKMKVKDVVMPKLVLENNAKGEDWSGFEVAVEKSNIREKNQILNIVRSQSLSTAREQKIREMTDIYTEIADQILPPLRRAEFAITCNKNKYTDEEIFAMAKTNDISTLNANEKMYAAANTNDLKAKETIYNNIINTQESQNDWRAYNGAGILAINDFVQTNEKANLNTAQTNLDKANAISPNNGIVLNNLGILYFLQGKKDEAKKAFEASQKAQIEPVKQDYNLGLFKIIDGDYTAATQAMGNRTCDYGVALSQLLNKDYSAAKQSIDCVQPKDAKAFYLAAVIGARQNVENDVISNLTKAIELDKNYAREALRDAEFKKFKTNSNFLNLVK